MVLIVASKNLPSSTPEETGWNVFYLGGFLLVIGSLLFGTVALRKSWLIGTPLLAIGLLAISNMVFLMGPFKVTGYEYVGTVVLPILIGFGWTALGYALWSYEARASQTPSELLKERYAPRVRPDARRSGGLSQVSRRWSKISRRVAISLLQPVRWLQEKQIDFLF